MQLFFGRNIPHGGTVSDDEWKDFVDKVITPRFPAGFTVFESNGQWRGAEGVVERERGNVFSVLTAGDAASERSIEEIAVEYKRRFRQEAVLKVKSPGCARLYE